MNHHVYILYSLSLNRFYVGQTTNLDKRIKQHNNGQSTYTSQGVPWNLIWSTIKMSLKEALLLESKIKNLSRARKVSFMGKYKEGISDLIYFENLKLKVPH